MALPAAIAGAVAEDWQVPLTVRVAAALLLIPAPAEPPVTFPVTVTLEDAVLSSIPGLFTMLPPVIFPVMLTVAAPVTLSPLELVTEPPLILPVKLSVPAPVMLNVELEVPPVGPLMAPVIDSVPVVENKTVLLIAVATPYEIAAATLAELPTPRLGVVMQGVDIAP